MMDKIKTRLNALPDTECKWKSKGNTVLDVRDRPIAEITSLLAQPIVNFIVNAPEDIARLLTEIERLEAEAAAMQMALEAIAKTETGYTEGDFATSCDCAYCLDMQEIAEKALATDAGRELLEALPKLLTGGG